MRILIAPDKFKDALDGPAVASAIADGIRGTRPDADIAVCPLGDGGEGTGQVIAEALNATAHATTVTDPLGRARDACWWSYPDDDLAIIEMAEASGLALLDPHERNALETTTGGTGQLLRAAIEAGCHQALLCVGGSATVDGGAGCLQSLGWTLLDRSGDTIDKPVTGGMLHTISGIRPPATLPDLPIRILRDVDNPLLGPRGAAPVFAPQKGASPDGVKTLEAGLANWAEVLKRATGCDMANMPGAGASGGLPAGLVAAMNATLHPGFDEVARYVNLDAKLEGVDLCITGEGCIDDQTAFGKVVAGVAARARQRKIRTVALTGAARRRPDQTLDDLAASVGVESIIVITPPNTPLSRALTDTAANLRHAASRLAAHNSPPWKKNARDGFSSLR